MINRTVGEKFQPQSPIFAIHKNSGHHISEPNKRLQTLPVAHFLYGEVCVCSDVESIETQERKKACI